MKHLIFIMLIATMACTGCSHDQDREFAPFVTLKIDVTYKVAQQPLYFDSLIYQNKAGEAYQVSTLKYYLSNIRFFNKQQLLFTSDSVFYMDAQKTASIHIANLPAGDYDSVAFFIGIDPGHNVHGNIPATAENVAMEWPEIMGGGYHFLKLEGRWKDGVQTAGFAIHLGTDPYLVTAGCRIRKLIDGYQDNNQLPLTMDLNEWFENPHTYSLETDGVYTMGDDALMRKITENGSDVFYEAHSH